MPLLIYNRRWIQLALMGACGVEEGAAGLNILDRELQAAISGGRRRASA
jgi:hypothetical protein